MSSRGSLLVVAVLVVALAACGGGAGPAGGSGTGEAADADAADSCGPVEETVDQGHHHLVGDSEPPVGYATTPPTSGWHYRDRDRIRTGVAPPDEPLSEAEQVSVLAVGSVVVTYHDLPPDQQSALVGLAEAYGDRVALSPYERLEPGEVALTAWQARQVCAGYDEAAVAAFVEEHAAPEPDYGMGGAAEPDHEEGH